MGGTLPVLSHLAAKAAPSSLRGRYTLHEEIGAGAMGTLYAATDEVLSRPVAIKRATLGAAGPDAAAAVLAEARAVAAVEHPHVVRVFDAGVEGGELFVVFERLHGEDLRALLRRRGRLAPDECVALLAPVADALAAAHARGVMHRDVKPENIFLARRASGAAPTLIDFGLSCLPTTNALAPRAPGGTPRYMAPERLRPPFRDGPPSDIWSLGVVLFECLCGRAPWTDDDPAALADAIARAPAPSVRAVAPEASPALAAVVARCLAAAPEDRYPSAAALRDALTRAGRRPTRPLMLSALALAATAALYVAARHTSSAVPSSPAAPSAVAVRTVAAQPVAPSREPIAVTVAPPAAPAAPSAAPSRARPASTHNAVARCVERDWYDLDPHAVSPSGTYRHPRCRHGRTSP